MPLSSLPYSLLEKITRFVDEKERKIALSILKPRLPITKLAKFMDKNVPAPSREEKVVLLTLPSVEDWLRETKSFSILTGTNLIKAFHQATTIHQRLLISASLVLYLKKKNNTYLKVPRFKPSSKNLTVEEKKLIPIYKKFESFIQLILNNNEEKIKTLYKMASRSPRHVVLKVGKKPPHHHPLSVEESYLERDVLHGVTYLHSEEERDPYRIYISNGQFIKLIKTSSSLQIILHETKGLKSRFGHQENKIHAQHAGLLVITSEGDLFCGSAGDRFYHSSFMAGGNIFFAGHILIKCHEEKTLILGIDRWSGHYQTTQKNGALAFCFLRDQDLIFLNSKHQKTIVSHPELYTLFADSDQETTLEIHLAEIKHLAAYPNEHVMLYGLKRSPYPTRLALKETKERDPIIQRNLALYLSLEINFFILQFIGIDAPWTFMADFLGHSTSTSLDESSFESLLNQVSLPLLTQEMKESDLRHLESINTKCHLEKDFIGFSFLEYLLHKKIINKKIISLLQHHHYFDLITRESYHDLNFKKETLVEMLHQALKTNGLPTPNHYFKKNNKLVQIEISVSGKNKEKIKKIQLIIPNRYEEEVENTICIFTYCSGKRYIAQNSGEQLQTEIIKELILMRGFNTSINRINQTMSIKDNAFWTHLSCYDDSLTLIFYELLHHNILIKLRAKLLSLSKQPILLIEIGCGLGHLIAKAYDCLKTQGFHDIETLAIDKNESNIQEARTLYPHLHFRQGDITEIELFPAHPKQKWVIAFESGCLRTLILPNASQALFALQNLYRVGVDWLFMGGLSENHLTPYAIKQAGFKLKSSQTTNCNTLGFYKTSTILYGQISFFLERQTLTPVLNRALTKYREGLKQGAGYLDLTGTSSPAKLLKQVFLAMSTEEQELIFSINIAHSFLSVNEAKMLVTVILSLDPDLSRLTLYIDEKQYHLYFKDSPLVKSVKITCYDTIDLLFEPGLQYQLFGKHAVFFAKRPDELLITDSKNTASLSN